MRRALLTAGTVACAVMLTAALPGIAGYAGNTTGAGTAAAQTVTKTQTAGGRVYADKTASTTTSRVSGKVAEGSSNAMLYLVTDAGTMQIRLDSSTDTSECRVLIVGSTVTADVYRGDDAYMHAARLMSGTRESTSVDTSNSTTVTGTVASGTTESLLMLTTAQGTMKIKIDSTTDLSGAGVLYEGKNLQVVVARGDDAYMHAVSIAANVGSTETTHPGSVTVSGTVAGGTNVNMLYLTLSDGSGTMKIRIDAGTDTSAGRVLVPGSEVSAEVYRGSDAVMHASKIVGRADTLTTSDTTQVKGTVSEGTTTTMLHLLTEQGLMLIKLDSSTDMSACGIILEGQYLYVEVARGSDAYMHALSIVNPDYTPQSTTGQTSSGGSGTTTTTVSHEGAREVSGGPTNDSSDSMLYLSTNEGTFQIKIDDDTQMASKAFMAGHTTRATIYHGTDGYMHAEKISDDQFQNNTADVGSDTHTVRGTIANDTSLNLLVLDSSDGTYKIKIDSATSMNGVRFLKIGRSVAVTFANGTDGYLHAVKIEP